MHSRLGCPLFDALGFELAAGGHDVASAWGADRACVAGVVDDVGELFNLFPVGAFERGAGPGVERD